MSKKSGFLARIQAEKEQSNKETLFFTRQNMCDAAMIALHEEFGFGPERLQRFKLALQRKYGDLADVWNGDTPDVEYARAAVDKKLQQCCGPYFEPWEKRYS